MGPADPEVPDSGAKVVDSNEGSTLKEDLDYLIKNNAELFNVTPPNAKDDDKSKHSGKYKLLQKNPANEEWRGFTPSKIEAIGKNPSNDTRSSNFSS